MLMTTGGEGGIRTPQCRAMRDGVVGLVVV
jgi:hypothetical protein